MPVVHHVGLGLVSEPGDVIIPLRVPEVNLVWDFPWVISHVIWDHVQEIAGVTGVTGANALRPVAVGNNSGSDFATARTAKGIASARGPERAHKRATAMRARMAPLFDDVFKG